MIILIDLDGPLADLEGEFLTRWKKKYPGELFVPFEERKNFFLNDDYPEHLRKQAADILEASGFFADLAPVTGGIDAMKKMVAAGHKVVMCTSDIYMNKTGLADKRAWVEKHLGRDLAKTMIFTRDKTLVRGDYLIDDKPTITGALTPEWKHIIFDQPFNRNSGAALRIKMDWSNWEEILVAASRDLG
jgi:5'-nucleotidase